VDRLGHLDGELSRRDEDECHRVAGVVAVAVAAEAFEDRQRERRRLPGAGGGLAEEVATFQQRRDRLALDRRRLLVAQLRERALELIAQREIGEGGRDVVVWDPSTVVVTVPTPFTELVGCDLPIQLAGMGGVSTPSLCAAVSAAGGLGMLGGSGTGEVASDMSAVAAATDRPFGVNFLMPFLDVGAVEVAAARCRVVELFYGPPDAALVSRVRAVANGALVSWQVGSTDEARAALDCGVDLVVAQGVEAGGHVRGTTPLRALLDDVVAVVDGAVPVVAAGGLSTAADVAAVIAAGASAARVGTRFLVCEEADVHPDYAAALLAATGDDTVLTTTFDAFWPDAPHRVLRSSVDAALAPGAPAMRSPLPPTRAAAGPVGHMALYAGTGVGRVTRTETAADVVRDLTRDLR
jgi:NAD(P)H-dependent flavin oxidoreductase YrpB (nitropropane dioxygenase family)